MQNIPFPGRGWGEVRGEVSWFAVSWLEVKPRLEVNPAEGVSDGEVAAIEAGRSNVTYTFILFMNVK